MNTQIYKLLHSLKYPAKDEAINILRRDSWLELAHTVRQKFELDEVAILTNAWALEMSKTQPFTQEETSMIHAFIDGFYEGKTA